MGMGKGRMATIIRSGVGKSRLLEPGLHGSVMPMYPLKEAHDSLRARIRLTSVPQFPECAPMSAPLLRIYDEDAPLSPDIGHDAMDARRYAMALERFNALSGNAVAEYQRPAQRADTVLTLFRLLANMREEHRIETEAGRAMHGHSRLYGMCEERAMHMARVYQVSIPADLQPPGLAESNAALIEAMVIHYIVGKTQELLRRRRQRPVG